MSLGFILGTAAMDHQQAMVERLAADMKQYPDDQFYYLVPNHIKFESELLQQIKYQFENLPYTVADNGHVEFTFEIQEDCAPDNYGQLYGYPSMMSGSVGSFSGFLKCQSVKLNCANATEAERNEIKQLLMSGIYI